MGFYLQDKMKYLCLLMALVAACEASNSYIVMAPNTVRPGMSFRVMMHVFQSTHITGVTVTVKRNGVTLVGQTLTIAKNRPRLFVIQIPADAKMGYFQLHVVGRGGVNFDVSKVLTFKSKDKSILIQSDKAIYKPGDKVQFRTLALYPTLMPYIGGMNISIHDAAGNKIRQWIEAKGFHGVIGKDFELSSQPVLGDWKIQVEVGSQKSEKIISIAKYVLPKFQANVLMPPYVLTGQKEIPFKVKSTYTYGKPVSGHMTVTAKLLYQHQDYDAQNTEVIFNLTDKIEGEGQINLPMTVLQRVRSYLNNYKLAVKAEVVESLTGNIMTDVGYVTLYNKGHTMAFPPINPGNFKPGLQYTAYLSVTQPDGRPLAVMDDAVEVTISVTHPTETKTPPPVEPVDPEEPGAPMTTMPPPTTQPMMEWYMPVPTTTYVLKTVSLSVSGNGLAVFTFDVPAHATSIQLRASYDNVYVSKTLEKSHSPSNSYIQVYLSEFTNIKAGSQIYFKASATMPMPTLVYQIMSRGIMVTSGVVEGLSRRALEFSVTAVADMAPNARIVLYFVRDDGEIVTDTIGFDVIGAFKNQVELRVSESEAEPGDEVRVHVTAEPSSYAFLLALDQSVLLLKSGNDITPNDIYNELEDYDTISHNDDGVLHSSPVEIADNVPDEANFMIGRSIWWPYPIFYGGSDATKIFQKAGVIVITDALVYKYTPPETFYPMPGTMPMEMMPIEIQEDGGGGAKGLKEPGRVRTKFPETWIWTEIKTCASGHASVAATVPDTITSWIASAFAVHSGAGFGIAPSTSKLTVFKPFFISLNLPYSVIRGEHVAIQVVIFNYLEEDQMVKVTMPRSSGYYSIYIDCNGVEDKLHVDQVHSFLVKAGTSRSMYFPIVTILLGYIDIEVRAQSFKAADGIRRQLLVEPEGVAMEINHAVLIDLTGDIRTFQKTLLIDLPDNVVEGSALAKISAIGDIMGPSISGLEKLLRLPTGCGEQTLLSLAPDVYITEYLQKTNQLSGSIGEKAISFMLRGYQQELTYKHSDGSFSAFGNSDPSGSMWLTAFVARVFHQASSHIYVDDNVLKVAINWMISKQTTNGSFPEPGRVIHKNMQGRASGGVALTTFVLISLYENEDLYDVNTTSINPTVSANYFNARAKALAYVEAAVAETEDLYLMAMASYAFQLARSEQLSDLLQRLSQKATRQGGLTYWHLPAEKKERPGFWHNPSQSSAIDTEVTSYVLLTLALRNDLGSGRNILQWVTQQRNPHGGFSSTQDTVVALQAMSIFAELVYSDMFSVDAKVSLDKEVTYTFNINERNALVSQRRQTRFIPSSVDIEATGHGIALVEVAVFFNIEKEIEDTSYSLKVNILNGTQNHFDIAVCTSRLGDNSETGMVVAEIGVLSGFEVDEESISKLKIIKRTEMPDRKVVLYLDEMTSEEICIHMRMDRTQLVARSRPAVVKVYDYYEPSFQVTGFYNYEALTTISICDICVDCENCAAKEEEELKEGTSTPAATTATAATEPPLEVVI